MYTWPDDSQGEFSLNERMVMSRVLNSVKDTLLIHHGLLATPIHFRPHIGQDDVQECYGWQSFRGHIAQDRREVILTKGLCGEFLARFRVDWAHVVKTMPDQKRIEHMASKATGMKSYSNTDPDVERLKRDSIEYLRTGHLPTDCQPLHV